MSAPTPTTELIAAVAELRAAIGDLHDMHECSEHCPEQCNQSNRSERAYRYHDEHNATVREDIELKACSLIDALIAWLGADSLAIAHGEVSW